MSDPVFSQSVRAVTTSTASATFALESKPRADVAIVGARLHKVVVCAGARGGGANAVVLEADVIG